MSNNKAHFEPGFYKNKSTEYIKSDLEPQGYQPLLIKEAPNDSLAPHKHAESHILVQVDGQMTITTGGEEVNMRPGDKLTIPPNVEHGAKFGPKGSQYLWVEF